jgi:Tol biopolymer transport system component
LFSDSDFLGEGRPDGTNEIWLYDRQAMTLTRVTSASHQFRYSQSPSPSEDGRWIAFASNNDFLDQGASFSINEIWLYDRQTMNLTRVTTTANVNRSSSSPAINSDGNWITFFSDADFLYHGIPDEQHEIWLYDRQAANLVRATYANPSGRDSRYPSISGDGRWVAFYSNADFLGEGLPGSVAEIWLYDRQAMTVTRVTSGSHEGRMSLMPSISADGRWVAFHSDSDFLGQGLPNDQFEIWLYDRQTTNLARVTYASGPDRDSRSPGLSGDGSWIAFASNSDFLDQGAPANIGEIWLYSRTAMTVTRITSASHSDRNSNEPSISRDGRQIAFISDSDFLGEGRANDVTEIWLWSLPYQVYLPNVLK